MKLRALAEAIGAALSGGGDVEITGAAGIAEAGPGQVTFAADARHLAQLDGCRASAAIVPADAPDRELPLLRARSPRLAFALALRALTESPYRAAGISGRAFVADGAVIGADPSIHPLAFIGANARIGDRVTVFPGAFIGAGSVIGDDTVIRENVSIGERVTIGRRVLVHAGTVIGSDGFGFVTDGGIHHKIPQAGGVVIEDDVEIGGNCSIDRATLGNTVIGRGTKIDNLVHIAHNVTVGEHCLLAAQAGIAGSTTLGSYVVFGGQVGVADHMTVGDRVMAGGKTVITKDVAPGSVIAGNYAMPLREWLKVQAILPKLPELKKMIAELERRVNALDDRQK